MSSAWGKKTSKSLQECNGQGSTHEDHTASRQSATQRTSYVFKRTSASSSNSTSSPKLSSSPLSSSLSNSPSTSRSSSRSSWPTSSPQSGSSYFSPSTPFSVVITPSSGSTSSSSNTSEWKVQRIPSKLTVCQSPATRYNSKSPPSSPLKAVWKNKSTSDCFFTNSVSPQTWRVSSAVSKPKKSAIPYEVDYTPVRDPLSRERIPSENTPDQESKPPRSLSQERRKHEDPVLASMRSPSNGKEEIGNQQPVKLLRQVFESAKENNKNNTSNLGKTRYHLRRSSKQIRHTVIGIDYPIEFKEETDLPERESLRRKSISCDTEHDVKDDVVKQSVQSLRHKFESHIKLLSEGSVRNITMEHANENTVTHDDVLASGQYSTSPADYKETIAVSSPTKRDLSVSGEQDSGVGNSEDLEEQEATAVGTIGGFERSSRTRSSVKDLRKKFEKFKEKSGHLMFPAKYKKDYRKAEANSSVLRSEALGLPESNGILHHEEGRESASSTPAKLFADSHIIPVEINISDVETPIEDAMNYKECEDPPLAVQRFSRTDSVRSSVKDLRRKFELSRNQSSSKRNQTTFVDGKEESAPVVYRKISSQREISSVAVNPSMPSEKVKTLRRNFLERTMSNDDSEESIGDDQVLLRKHENEETARKYRESLPPKDMSRMIGMFEVKDVDEPRVQPTYTAPTINRLNLAMLQKSVGSDGDSDSDYDAPPLPENSPPLVKKLNIEEFTKVLRGDPESRSVTSKGRSRSVSKLNLEEVQAALNLNHSENHLNINLDTDVIQKANVSNLVDQFANSSPHFMANKPGRRQRSATIDGMSEEDVSIIVDKPSSTVTKESSIQFPGKVRELTSNEMKFFSTENGKDKSFLETYKQTSRDQPSFQPVSPQLLRLKSEEQPFQRRGSLKLPGNCRELHDDEKELFFGGNAASVFTKSTGIKRSTSDVSSLGSHRQKLFPKSDFRDRGKGREHVSDEVLMNYNEPCFDMSILRDAENFENTSDRAYYDTDLHCVTSSPRGGRSLDDANISYEDCNSSQVFDSPLQTFFPISFAPQSLQNTFENDKLQSTDIDLEMQPLVIPHEVFPQVIPTTGKDSNVEVTVQQFSGKESMKEQRVEDIIGNLRTGMQENDLQSDMSFFVKSLYGNVDEELRKPYQESNQAEQNLTNTTRQISDHPEQRIHIASNYNEEPTDLMVKSDQQLKSCNSSTEQKNCKKLQSEIYVEASVLDGSSNKKIVEINLDVDESKLDIKASMPKVKDTKLEVSEAKPVVNEAKPVVNEAKPVVNETKPVVNETKPVVNETKPVVNETKPVVNETKPVVNETKPVVNETKPVVNKTKPVGNETKPVVNETKPVVNETKPVVNETKPEFKESKPEVEESKPDVAIVKPVESKPIEVERETLDQRAKDPALQLASQGSRMASEASFQHHESMNTSLPSTNVASIPTNSSKTAETEDLWAKQDISRIKSSESLNQPVVAVKSKSTNKPKKSNGEFGSMNADKLTTNFESNGQGSTLQNIELSKHNKFVGVSDSKNMKKSTQDDALLGIQFRQWFGTDVETEIWLIRISAFIVWMTALVYAFSCIEEFFEFDDD